MKIMVVYDDTGRKSEVIEDIIGDKGFADVVVKKKRLEEYYETEVRSVYPKAYWKKIHSVFEYEVFLDELEKNNPEDIKVLHCLSNFFVSDSQKFVLSMKKLEYIENDFGVWDNKQVAAAMFPSVNSYIRFCKNIIAGQRPKDLIRNIKEKFEIEGLVDIGLIGNFIQCVTGNFDSRYFNSLKGNEYTLVKSSTNKEKIRSEYNFYHLLPENMRYWFVMPFDYKEDLDRASYTMERLHMTDLAIKWVHGSMDESEFEELLDKYFFFFSIRHQKECTIDTYRKEADKLYIEKLNERIKALKLTQEYKKIEILLRASDDINIDNLIEKYYDLKEKIENRIKYPNILVIGHGDPCFANTLYNKSTKTLKFIDPKGASTEEELWTNPYYDIAKLSHSICGNYDFFNNALFEIKIDSNFEYSLEIPFDNSVYKDIFKRKVEENGYDYLSVRIYEVSLFLSMLPLHIDNPHKVLGFILNVRNILKEIEDNV